ncbi:unnamed protein product [Symbiodinium sp. CCMP2592]|nr:unnamed protein product [Symbiodinium sp. CCMP2592]
MRVLVPGPGNEIREVVLPESPTIAMHWEIAGWLLRLWRPHVATQMICLHLRLALSRVDARSCARPRKLRDGRLSPASYSISKQLDRARRRGSQARQETLPKTSPTLNNQAWPASECNGGGKTNTKHRRELPVLLQLQVSHAQDVSLQAAIGPLGLERGRAEQTSSRRDVSRRDCGLGPEHFALPRDMAGLSEGESSGNAGCFGGFGFGPAALLGYKCIETAWHVLTFWGAPDIRLCKAPRRSGGSCSSSGHRTPRMTAQPQNRQDARTLCKAPSAGPGRHHNMHGAQQAQQARTAGLSSSSLRAPSTRRRQRTASMTEAFPGRSIQLHSKEGWHLKSFPVPSP